MTIDPPHRNSLIPTRDSLISRLKDLRDDDSWRDFFNTYWRLIYGVAIKSGLSAEEADEVVQETLITVARRIPEFHYDPAVCSFKTWLMNLTRWRIVDQIRKRRVQQHRVSPFPEVPQTGTAPIERLPDPRKTDLTAVWDEEWRRILLDTAIQNVKQRGKPEHYQVFHLCVFKEWPVRKVAQELGLGVTQVYLAKHRIAAQLKKELKKLEKRMNER
jgi:RNA polymerase sigma factor (sigma-70 family)